MALCTRCAQLDIIDFTDWEKDLQDVPHLASLWDLKVSASTCSFCNLLFQQFSQSSFFKQPEPEQKSSQIILRGAQCVDEDWNQGAIYLIRARCANPDLQAWLGLYVDKDDHVLVPDTIVIGRPIKPPQEQFGLVEKWIRSCEENHSQCASVPHNLPKRVIDVGVQGLHEPKLVETAGQEAAHYMTLSHCWGKKPVIKTTTNTLKHYLKELPMGSLPDTFRDAVTITRALGIQYLWIDSLCIIQDNTIDWEQQSAVMGSIYASSYMTIAASASRDSSGGCFLPRATDTNVRIKCTLEDGKEGHVVVRPKACGFKDLDHSFLQTRAWVAQERLLSPRALHYDIDQIMWECKEVRLTEDGVPVGVDLDSRQADIWDGRFHLKYPFLIEGSSSYRDFVWDWYAMLDNYTSRNLTDADDKLPALSGLASVMISRTGDRYAAGLWESHLHVGLLWKRIPKDPWLTSPKQYRAPSWSWAAYDGAVITQTNAGLNSSSSPHLSTIDVNKVDINPLGLDLNGRLKSGSITVTARLKKVRPRENPDGVNYKVFPEDGLGQDIIRDHFTGESIGCVNFDEAYIPGGGALFCLQMTERKHPNRTVCHCLVLEYTENRNIFKRVGAGLTGVGDSRAGWFEDAGKKNICII